MSETDKLRALLDGRGVKWTKVPDEPQGTNEYLLSLTYWGDAGEQGSYVASEVFGGLKVDPLTARQAVDATLGREECEMRSAEGSFSSVNRPVYHCECGAFCTDYTDATAYHKPRYCPNCGKAVKR